MIRDRKFLFSGHVDIIVVINSMLTKTKFENIKMEAWCDMGNMSSLKSSRELFTNSFNVLNKPDESLFLIDSI